MIRGPAPDPTSPDGRRYRRLLRIFFSAHVRRRDGAEMEAAFLRLLAIERRDRGVRGVVWAWTGAVLDGIRNGWLRGPGGPGEGRMSGLRWDLRHAVRAFRHAPMFTAATAGTLALGVGAVATIFTVVHGVLIDPLPFDEPDELVSIWHTAPGWSFDEVPVAPQQWLTYLEENEAFDGLGLWASSSLTVAGQGDAELVEAVGMTNELLPVLGVQPVVGRRFALEDDLPGASMTVMLGHAYWRDRFGGDADVVGSTLSLGGGPADVIGVLPEAFSLPGGPPDLVFPLRMSRTNLLAGGYNYRAIARLKPGATIEAASRDVARMIPLSTELHGGTPVSILEAAGFAPDLRTLRQDYLRGADRVLWVLLGTVGIVLLIACANVGNLFAVRLEGRRHELSVRRALGATRARVVRQVVVEGGLLGLCGGACGLALTAVGVRTILRIAPAWLPRADNIGLGPEAVLVALGAAASAGIVFGVLPLVRLTTSGASVSLREGGRGGSAGKSTHRTRSLLVVGQVAMALVLLAGSGLLVRSFQALRGVEPGFSSPEEVVVVRMSVPNAVISDLAEVRAAYETIEDRVAELPGVVSVAAASCLTLEGCTGNEAIHFRDRPIQEGESPLVERFRIVTGGYFETMQQALVAGRTIQDADVRDHNPVVVISENFARRHWGDATRALGQLINWGSAGGNWSEIVGVVADERDDGLFAPPPAVTYWPLATAHSYVAGMRFVPRAMSFAVRTTRRSPTTLVPEIRDILRSVSADVAIVSPGTLEDVAASSMATVTFMMIMLLTSAAVALTLGLVGIYGVISYLTGQRTREIGVRIALGAREGQVRDMVLRQGLALSLVGVGVGLVAARLISAVIAAQLYGVTPSDPLTFGVAAVALTVMATLAVYVPARRAARTDPLAALRSD